MGTDRGLLIALLAFLLAFLCQSVEGNTQFSVRLLFLVSAASAFFFCLLFFACFHVARTSPLPPKCRNAICQRSVACCFLLSFWLLSFTSTTTNCVDVPNGHSSCKEDFWIESCVLSLFFLSFFLSVCTRHGCCRVCQQQPSVAFICSTLAADKIKVYSGLFNSVLHRIILN